MSDPTLKEVIDSLISSRATSGGIKRAKGDEGEFEMDSIKELAEAKKLLAESCEIEGRNKLSKPIVTRISDPNEPSKAPGCGC